MVARLAPCESCRVRPSTVYIDESGNAGDVAGDPAPFTAQPTFALAGVVEEEGSGAAAGLIRDLRASHHLQAPDLKWKSFARNPRAFLQLVRSLPGAGLVPFVELMDKRHYVANNIVTYVLGNRRLDFGNKKLRSIANDFADLLAADLGDAALLAYAQLAKEPTNDRFETFLLMLRAGMHDAIEKTLAEARNPHKLAVLMFMDEVLDGVVAAWRDAGAQDVERFVQEPDETAAGHRLGLLPHVQAFSNLCGRLNSQLSDQDEVRLIHDEQNEFRALIERYLALLTSNAHKPALAEHTIHADAPISWAFPAGKFRLSFGDSNTIAGVQIADIIAGFCRTRLDAVSRGRRPDGRFDAAARELAEVSSRTAPAGVLFVTTRERIAGFLGDAPQ